MTRHGPAAGASGTEPWRTFPRRSTYRLGGMGRFASMGGAALLLAISAFLAPLAFGVPPELSVSAIAWFVVILVAFGGATAALLTYGLNKRFVLTPDSVTAHGLGAAVALPLARLEAATIKRERGRNQGPTGWYTVRLHAEGGARGPTLSVEEFHLRDDALFAWLSAIPRRGGDDLSWPLPRHTSIFEGIALVGMGMPFLAAFAFVASLTFATGRDLLLGYPPLANLSVVQGPLVQVSDCLPLGHGRSQITAIVRDISGDRAEALDCDFGPPLRDLPGPHRLAVWRDRRVFSDGDARQVEVDGQVLRSYARGIFLRSTYDPAKFAGQVLLLAAMALFAAGCLASARDRAPSEG